MKGSLKFSLTSRSDITSFCFNESRRGERHMSRFVYVGLVPKEDYFEVKDTVFYLLFTFCNP